MSDPKWMKFVRWPACADCKQTGVAIDPKTNWPTECLRCKQGREAAITTAQADLKHERKHGGGP